MAKSQAGNAAAAPQIENLMSLKVLRLIENEASEGSTAWPDDSPVGRLAVTVVQAGLPEIRKVSGIVCLQFRTEGVFFKGRELGQIPVEQPPCQKSACPVALDRELCLIYV